MARVRARLRARVRVTVRARVGLRLRARARARLRARVRVRVRVRARDRLRLRLRLRARLRARVRARARWLGLGAAARANAGVLLGPGTHPSGLGEHNARNAPCPKPAACPTLAARQCQLDLTACDRWGTRRVGRARRGGVWLSRGAPGQSRRAQRARRALPEAGSVPNTAAHASSSSISPPAIGTECDASTGRCGAVWVDCAGPSPHAMASAKGAHELHRLHTCQGLPRNPRHGGTSLLEPTSDRRDTPPSMEPARHRNGAAASPKGARTARRRERPEQPGGSACCWYLLEGEKNEDENRLPPEAENDPLGSLLTS